MEGNTFLTEATVLSRPPPPTKARIQANRHSTGPKKLPTSSTPRLPRLSTQRDSHSLSKTRLSKTNRSTPSLLSSGRGGYFGKSGLSASRVSVAHEVLDSIAREATQTVDLYYDNTSQGNPDTVRDLEKSKNIQKQMNIMEEHVKLNRSRFNFISDETSRLSEKLTSLNQTLNDLGQKDKVQTEWTAQEDDLNSRYYHLQELIAQQSKYKQVLEHMIHVRKINVNMLQEPVKNIRAQVKRTDQNKAAQDKEIYRISMQIKEGEMNLQNKKKEAQQEKTRQQQVISQDLKMYKEKRQAIQVYKREKEMGELRAQLRQREREMKRLKAKMAKQKENERYEQNVEDKREYLANQEEKFAKIQASTQINTIKDMNSHYKYLQNTQSTLIDMRNYLLEDIQVTKEKLDSHREVLDTVRLNQEQEVTTVGTSRIVTVENDAMLKDRELDFKMQGLRNLEELAAKANSVFDRLMGKMNFGQSTDAITTSKLMPIFAEKIGAIYDKVKDE